MADTTSTRLLEPVLDAQDRYPHFFNGRILTAADLRDARDAQRRDTARLGSAVGTGVVSGFEVVIDFAGTAGDPPRLTLFGGLAVNGCGQSLKLARERLTLSLGDPATPAPKDAGLFADCGQGTPSTAGVSASLSILVVYPTSAFAAEKAPLRGQPGDGAGTGCGARYALSGVAFREIALPVASAGSLGALTQPIASLLEFSSPDAKQLATLRNLLAHACFALDDPAAADDPWLRLPATPARANDAHGLLDLLRDSGDLSDCDVPLALIHRTGASVGFIDMWSVRRRLTTPFAGEPWPGLLADRRASESEAALLQFQEQLEALRLPPYVPGNVKAKEHFRFLPAAGLLPVGGTDGFSLDTFFSDLTRRDEDVDPAFLRLLFEQSRYLDPVDLDPANDNGTSAFRLLRPRGINAYRVFVRDEWRPATTPSTPSTPTTTPDEAKPTTGSLRIVLRLDAKAIAALLKKYKVTAGQTQLPADALTIEVRDSAKHSYAPARRQDKGISGTAGKNAVDFANGSAEFFCDDLSPDTYTVTVKGPVIASASQSKAVRADAETRFEFTLTARQTPSGPVKPGTRPSRDIPGKWIKQRPIERLWLMDRFLAWPWPPEPEWDKHEWVADPSPEGFRDWTALWSEVLQVEYPDAPIDAGQAHIIFDPAYEPGATSIDPYAYIVFGDSGAYAPLIATTADHDLAGAVGAGRAGVPGIDAEASSRLAAQGFDRVDILANAWVGGVADALGASRGVATALVSSARLRSEALKGSALQIAGIDAKAAEAFDKAGITMETLASASASGNLNTVVSALQGIGYDPDAANTYANVYAGSAAAMKQRRQ